jgi:hypothetical protein
LREDGAAVLFVDAEVVREDEQPVIVGELLNVDVVNANVEHSIGGGVRGEDIHVVRADSVLAIETQRRGGLPSGGNVHEPLNASAGGMETKEETKEGENRD